MDFKKVLDVATSIVLQKWGLTKFDNLRRLISTEEYGDEVPDMDLWLIPGDKYDQIPAGYPLVTIFGKQMTFEPGKSDNDVRFGCLPYGVLRPSDENCKANESVQFVLSKTVVRGRQIFAAGEPATESWQLPIVACEAYNYKTKRHYYADYETELGGLTKMAKVDSSYNDAIRALMSVHQQLGDTCKYRVTNERDYAGGCRIYVSGIDFNQLKQIFKTTAGKAGNLLYVKF